MEIKKLKINDLIVAEYNPRKDLKPGDKEYEDIKNNIKRFGYIEPIIINIRDDKKRIVSGHQRVKVLNDLKYLEADCVLIDVSEDEEKAINISMNKICGVWDNDKLGQMLEDIKNVKMLEFTGFSDEEFSKIIKNFNEESEEIKEDNFDTEKAKKEAEENTDKDMKQDGQIWKLGSHILMCGDSTNEDDLRLLMCDSLADMVFTDPPYGLNYSGGRVVNKIKGDDLKEKELGLLIENVFTFNKSEADIYICVSPILQKPFLDYIEEAKKNINAVIVWNKKNPGLGFMSYRRQCEFILFIKGGKFKKGDRSDFDYWELSKDDTSKYKHGNQKPVSLAGRAIRNSSKKDDIVLDLFGGSGSTLLACEQLGRKCRMLEIDIVNCNVIIQRFEEYTGKKAELVGGG